MSEKLHIPSHRYGTKEYRDNWDKIFRGKEESKKKNASEK